MRPSGMHGRARAFQRPNSESQTKWSKLLRLSGRYEERSSSSKPCLRIASYLDKGTYARANRAIYDKNIACLKFMPRSAEAERVLFPLSERTVKLAIIFPKIVQ